MKTIFVIMFLFFLPASAFAATWSPGTNTSNEIYSYVICDTIRTVCYETNLEFLRAVLHDETVYWLVIADMNVLAGLPYSMESNKNDITPQPWVINGDPTHDINILKNAIPVGIPEQVYVFLFDNMFYTPFLDESRILHDSIHDTILGIDTMMTGPGIVKKGEYWGNNLIVKDVVGELLIVEYGDAGSASFLIDPTKPFPLAGIYEADRHDPLVDADMWFYDKPQHMEILLGIFENTRVDLSGPTNILKSGTLDRTKWSSDTYNIQSITTQYDKVVIRGSIPEGVQGGTLRIVMPAFGDTYTFRQGNSVINGEYHISGGVLTANIQHGNVGDIIIYSVPSNVCTGECLQNVIIRAWDDSSPTAVVYGGGFHGSIRLTMTASDPNNIASTLCPVGSVVSVDLDDIQGYGSSFTLPYTTTYETSLQNITMTRNGNTVSGTIYGEESFVTFRIPAMLGNIKYMINDSIITPNAETKWYDILRTTIHHSGGMSNYEIKSDGVTAWGSGLAISKPVDRTGVIWCGMSEPVNALVIQDSGPARQDCGLTKFSDEVWNTWC